MSDVERHLHALALAAQEHARDRHGQQLSLTEATAIDRADEILDRERALEHLEYTEPLTVCFGAWLGEYVRQHLGGEWVGLSEPTPPRIRFHSTVYSPMDAVRRRLAQDTAPTLRTLVDRVTRVALNGGSESTADNRVAWDLRADDPRFTFTGALPASSEEAREAIDPWLTAEGPLEGRNVLCLAAGGGTHAPLHALAGARVTVVDLSPKQLEHDRRLADANGLVIQRIATSMDDLSSLSDHSFDAVIHPVSLCYVQQVAPVYREIARVLRSGGLYISQQKQPGSLQATALPDGSAHVVESPAEDGRELPTLARDTPLREMGTREFVHSLDALLGSLCRNGFVIEEIREPPRGDAWAPIGSPEHRARYLPPYLKIKARRC